MSARLFKSYSGPTKDDIAAQRAEETIFLHQQSRMGRETEPLTSGDQSRLSYLAALLTGPRRAAVKPVVDRLWPDFAKICDQKVGQA